MLNHLAKSVSKNAAFRWAALLARDGKQRAALKRLRNLNAYERRTLSQNGEDGIISELFARIPHNRYFVEIGVEDGEQCNTALLARHYGWTGLMIEADEAQFKRLAITYDSLPVKCIQMLVDRDNIAPALRAAGTPERFDLLSIDIDGNDYYVWEATASFSPSVVVIEYNASFGPRASRTIEYNPSHSWRKDRYYGASLMALADLGRRLGYALIGTDRRGINAFFIRRDLLPASGFDEKTSREAWRPNLLIRLLPRGNGRLADPGSPTTQQPN
jgi:hypothetical protein